MIEARPATEFMALLEDAPSGLVGTLGVRIDASGGSTVVPRTTAGIVEVDPPGSGVYAATLTSPDQKGSYVVLWDTGGATPQFASEDLEVTYSATPVSAQPPGGGVFPFRSAGQVQDRGGNVLAEVVCDVWRDTDGVAGDAGEEYDYAGIVPLGASDAVVERRNRDLMVNGTTYRIVGAIPHDVLPHIELALRRVRADG